MRIGEILIAAIGGILLGFTFGMTDMYNKTMGGLGLIEGGTPSYLDIETLYHVSRLMSDIFPVSKAHTFGIAGLVVLSISVLIVFSVSIWKTAP